VKENAALIAVLSGWTLWHDVGIYSATGPTRLGGPMYAASTYETETDCLAGQREAMKDEARPHRGPLTERLPDGVKVWDESRHHYTTFRYHCAPTSARFGPMPMSR
jgi:hypothetical protein